MGLFKKRSKENKQQQPAAGERPQDAQGERRVRVYGEDVLRARQKWGHAVEAGQYVGDVYVGYTYDAPAPAATGRPQVGSTPAGALVCSGESPVVNVLVRPEVVKQILPDVETVVAIVPTRQSIYLYDLDNTIAAFEATQKATIDLHATEEPVSNRSFILEDGKWAAFSMPAGEYDGAFRAAVHRAEAAVMAPSLAANGQHVAVAPPVYSEGRIVAEVSRGRPVLVPSSATAYRMVDEGAGVSVVVDAKDFAAVPGLLADAGTDGWHIVTRFPDELVAEGLAAQNRWPAVQARMVLRVGAAENYPGAGQLYPGGIVVGVGVAAVKPTAEEPQPPSVPVTSEQLSEWHIKLAKPLAQASVSQSIRWRDSPPLTRQWDALTMVFGEGAAAAILLMPSAHLPRLSNATRPVVLVAATGGILIADADDAESLRALLRHALVDVQTASAGIGQLVSPVALINVDGRRWAEFEWPAELAAEAQAFRAEFDQTLSGGASTA